MGGDERGGGGAVTVQCVKECWYTVIIIPCTQADYQELGIMGLESHCLAAFPIIMIHWTRIIEKHCYGGARHVYT